MLRNVDIICKQGSCFLSFFCFRSAVLEFLTRNYLKWTEEWRFSKQVSSQRYLSNDTCELRALFQSYVEFVCKYFKTFMRISKRNIFWIPVLCAIFQFEKFSSYILLIMRIKKWTSNIFSGIQTQRVTERFSHQLSNSKDNEIKSKLKLTNSYCTNIIDFWMKIRSWKDNRIIWVFINILKISSLLLRFCHARYGYEISLYDECRREK